MGSAMESLRMLPSLAKIPFVFNYSGTLRGVTAVAKLLSLFIFAAQILTIFPISSASAQVTPERPVVIIPGLKAAPPSRELQDA